MPPKNIYRSRKVVSCKYCFYEKNDECQLRVCPYVAERITAKVSEPPRRITASPAFRQRMAASMVTLGRDSKIMAMTPSGMRILPIMC